jgi:putative membrane protein
MTRMLKGLLAVALLITVTPAASASQPTPTPPSTPSTPPTTTPPPTGATTAPAAAPTDAQIVHILNTANNIDIDDGKLAKRRTENAAVQTFAERMIGDHTALNTRTDDLTSRLDLTPEDNDTSKAMMTEHETYAATLKDLEGAAFDKAYVDHEVTFHASVLDQIDRVLLPNARNAELKTLIEGARPVIAAHLEHARQLQQQVTPGATAPAMLH